jgi:hypothetical protein
MLLLPGVLSIPAAAPSAVFWEPVLSKSAARPTAVFASPVLKSSAATPTAVLKLPAVVLNSENAPNAIR